MHKHQFFLPVPRANRFTWWKRRNVDKGMVICMIYRRRNTWRLLDRHESRDSLSFVLGTLHLMHFVMKFIQDITCSFWQNFLIRFVYIFEKEFKISLQLRVRKLWNAFERSRFAFCSAVISKERFRFHLCFGTVFQNSFPFRFSFRNGFGKSVAVFCVSQKKNLFLSFNSHALNLHAACKSL